MRNWFKIRKASAKLLLYIGLLVTGLVFALGGISEYFQGNTEFRTETQTLTKKGYVSNIEQMRKADKIKQARVSTLSLNLLEINGLVWNSGDPLAKFYCGLILIISMHFAELSKGKFQ